ncbi:unnamed protein product [Calypogeia fissa]
MSNFRNYTFRVLERADRTALAAALTTIYKEGMGSFPQTQTGTTSGGAHIPSDTFLMSVPSSQSTHQKGKETNLIDP